MILNSFSEKCIFTPLNYWSQLITENTEYLDI
jgi:hypothetical protein